MSDSIVPGVSTATTGRLRAAAQGSMGQKLLLVCGLALLMAIPALFVFGLLRDRTTRAQTVQAELGAMLGGPQTMMGPVLAVPYARDPAAAKPPSAAAQPGDTTSAPAATTGPSDRAGVLIVFPRAAATDVDETTEIRKRSLFRTPVFRARIRMHARFDLSAIQAPQGMTLVWSQAEMLVGASEPRGAVSDVIVNFGTGSVSLAPATLVQDVLLEQPVGDARTFLRPRFGLGAGANATLHLFGANAGAAAKPGARFDADGVMTFSGAQRLSVLAYGETSTLKMRGDWPHPSFDGGFLPVRQSVTPHGFTAEWSVPSIARSLPGEAVSPNFGKLGRTDLGVSFADPADPYKSVGRSLKYALLFVSLVFLTLFVLEATTGVAVHPAQYVLVGLAQIVFYLLLLSMAEHLGFDVAFLLAAGATVGLIAAYAGQVFRSRRQGLVAMVAFGVLYGLIYILMRLEDYALLVGAVASFAAIAAVMYLTRRLDWYGRREAPEAATGPAPPPL